MRDEETGDEIDEVEDALMKAEETGDEGALIQIVEDLLMKDVATEEKIEIEIDKDDEESI